MSLDIYEWSPSLSVHAACTCIQKYYISQQKYRLKGIVHPKMKILSLFTHPQVVPNLYECLCSAEHKGRYSEECGKQSSSGALLTSIVFFFPTMEVNGAPKQPGYKLSSKYLPLCSAEQRHSYRFGTTWGWVNDDIIFIFGWTIPLRPAHSKNNNYKNNDKDIYIYIYIQHRNIL